jgi:hypothetical protein
VFIQCLAQLVQFVDVVGGLDGEEIGLGDHGVGGAVGIIQVKKLVLGFQMGEVLAGENGGGTFADAAFGLWADDESLHGFLLWLKMDAEFLGG